MKKIVFGIGMFLVSNVGVNAQDENDAIRYSMNPIYGTARAMSLGGANGSLGGDATGLTINPATLGLYRTSELTFTTGLEIKNIDALYNSKELNKNTAKFNFNNVSLVVADKKQNNNNRQQKNWRAVNFAIGYNRIANLNSNYDYKGIDKAHSLIEAYAEEFNSFGGLTDDAKNSVSDGAYAAYQNYLIDKDPMDSTKATSFVPTSGGLERLKSVEQSGNIGELFLSIAGNYKEKLMLGATVGLNNLRYSKSTLISENDISGNKDNDFDNFKSLENLTTIGTGVNLKLGAVLRANDYLRFGLAFHTPTSYYLNDNSTFFMNSNTDSLLIRSGVSANGNITYSTEQALVYDYTFSTPMKTILSATALFGKKGFLTGDIEVVNYDMMRYRFSGNSLEATSRNNVIKNIYKTAINYRIGAEINLNQIQLRAGAAYYGSPFESTNENNGGRLNLSAGLGYRVKSWYLDFGYVYGQQNFQDLPFVLNSMTVAAANISQTTHNAVLTLGFKF